MGMKVVWQENLSIGVTEIDNQHKLLFEKFNDFLSACKAGRGNDEVNQLFWFLEVYASTHFAEEEQLMQHLGFPDFPTHREQHLAFTHEVALLKERLKKEGPTPSLVSTVNRLITGWLSDHIANMDRAIGRFIKDEEH
jgi:hemerythrin